jgi:hypothetical protein
MKKNLHVISFDNPYPANYGGAIDVYYKLKALKKSGCYIILHIYLYKNKKEAVVNLSEIADEIYFYPRKTGLKSNLGLKPYIVYSRRDESLLENLLKDEHPILFEGLHCCFLLDHPSLKNRSKWVRNHNIEHHYYHFLAQTSSSIWKKLYYYTEAFRLKKYEHKLGNASILYAISEKDKLYFQEKFPTIKTILLPCFNNGEHTEVVITEKEGDYLLYHGNLGVEENLKAIYFLLKEVIPLTNPIAKWVIAGKNPPPELYSKVNLFNQVEIVSNPTDEELNQLIQKAQANILITFQPTGVKLKLLNALYKGGFCIVNSMILEGTDLADHCIIANSPIEISDSIKSITNLKFTQEEKKQRLKKLELTYSNITNAKRILENWPTSKNS